MIKTGLVNLLAVIADDDKGLMMLICLGTKGTDEPLLFTLDVGEINRIVDGEGEFDSVKRKTRALLFAVDETSGVF